MHYQQHPHTRHMCFHMLSEIQQMNWAYCQAVSFRMLH